VAEEKELTESMTVAELFRALRAHRLSMWLAGGTTFAIVVAFVLLVPPRYRSEALLRVESKSPDAGLLGSLDEVSGLSALGLGRDEVETEIGVLGSRRMRDAAIDSLGLEVVVTNPHSGRSGVIRARSAGESTLDGTIRLARTGANVWSVAASWKGDSAHIAATATTGQPLRVGPLDITVIAADTIKTIELRLLPRFKVHEQFDDRLQVRRRSPGAKLIEVRYEDRDRQLTAQVVGVLVGAYLDYAHLVEMGDARKTILELRHSADSVAGALRAADERLRDYETEAKLIAPTEQATLEVRRVAVLRTQLDQVELERDALTRLLALVDERSRGGRDAGAYRDLATFPTLISNRGIQDLLGALMQLETDRAKLGVRRTDENADYRALTERIAQLERELRRVGAQYQENLGQQFTETSRALSRLTEGLGALPAAEMRYVQLVRERTLLGETWVTIRKSLKQAELQDALRLERVRLVDAASVPQARDKVFPRPIVYTVLGLVLAILVAFATGLAAVIWRGPGRERSQPPAVT
jgi:uncharacterized protein involved in exopolysaccharide biosynthesis